MKNYRTYGKAPFDIAVLHGGPGAAGQMAPVAKKLSRSYSVLEPLQTALSVKGQVEELHTILKNLGELPVVLIGSSWGAMLGYIFTAHHTSFVKKLIMVGSAAFQDKYTAEIQTTRFSRLKDAEKKQAVSLLEQLNNDRVKNKNKVFFKLGELFTKADAYHPVGESHKELKTDYNIYLHVWTEAMQLRSSGKLLEMGEKINCPVVAIHGDYDPHPARGVEEPLKNILGDFKFILLQKCGHLPWVEKEARDTFYQLLKNEIDLK